MLMAKNGKKMTHKIYKVKDLISPDYNPRKISISMMTKLKESINKFGLVQPIILNIKTGKIVGGNQRTAALKELYGENYEVEVTEVDLTEEEEKTLNIALNKINADWDDDKLQELLQSLDEESLKLSGFEEIELVLCDDLPDIDILGRESGIRSPLTFWFETEKERDKIMKEFTNKFGGWKYSKEPNALFLKELINSQQKGAKSNNGGVPTKISLVGTPRPVGLKERGYV